MDFKKLRLDFPVLTNKKEKIIYLDSAASSLKPRQVIEGMNAYYNECPVNIHRGIHRLSMRASVVYEETIDATAKFFNCKREEVIFTNNSTDSINMVSQSLLLSNYFKKGDEILLTVMEHHANLVPWQVLSQRLGLKLKFIEIKKDFTLDYDDFRKKLSKKTKLVAVTHISNTIATKNNIDLIIKEAHEFGALVLIDGSQSAPHEKIDFKKLNADFFVCTMHKMLGPTGIGILLAKEPLLKKLSPTRFGGDMVSKVTLEKSEWNTLPYKFMAGTPNISGVFGTKSALEYLKKVGLDNIENHDKELLSYAIKRTKEIDNLTLYGPGDANKQGSILLFSLKGIACTDLSALLDDMSGIGTRAGMHCAEPIVSRFSKEGLTRASFYLYNTKEEVDSFIESLKKIDKIVNKKR